jgi:hypothetical protein
MSRSGYDDCGDATRGKRGQALLREMAAALDAMPNRRLIHGALEQSGEVCALGAVGKRRFDRMDDIDVEDFNAVAEAFNVAAQLAREIMYINDERCGNGATPERRWTTVRAWVASQVKLERE